MKQILILLALATLASPARRAILFQEDFEDENLAARGFIDIAKWGEGKSLSIAGPPEVKANTGQRCLKIRYAQGDTGGWLHRLFKGVPEVYCRYYRLFPAGWEWPKGYGPHDTLLYAGRFNVPTDTDLSIYLDFWKSADTLVRVATARQKWGYGGYGELLRKYGGVANQTPYNVDPADKVQLGQWHCVEFYARLSDPGKENGCLRLWVNGKLVSELDGLPLVDEQHGGILFDRWMLGPYFHGGSHKEQWNYLDSLVVATSYIGTLEQKGNQPPRARFACALDWGSMSARLDASRSADPDGRIVRYAWEFGDGQSGAGQSVSHAYAQPGDYTVKLTVADEKGAAHTTSLGLSVGPAVGSGTGLKAEYFDGQTLEGKPMVRVARRIAFQRRGWDGRFLTGGVGDNNGDNYSCRWTGFVQPTRSEEFTLTFEVNDGGRVWFDGRLVLDAWDRPQTKSASVGLLEAGRKYPIRVEHHKGTFDATRDWKAILFWETPSLKREPIPTTQLYPPAWFVEP
jgi:hypothetical protein